jgi:hypothetical protein
MPVSQRGINLLKQTPHRSIFIKRRSIAMNPPSGGSQKEHIITIKGKDGSL